jgi:hypothetical protein
MNRQDAKSAKTRKREEKKRYKKVDAAGQQLLFSCLSFSLSLLGALGVLAVGLNESVPGEMG